MTAKTPVFLNPVFPVLDRISLSILQPVQHSAAPGKNADNVVLLDFIPFRAITTVDIQVECSER